LLPAFAAFVDAPLEISYFGAGGIALPVILLTAFVGLIGGVYPAFHLSAFRPDRVLKAAAAPGGGTDRIRQLLVVGQFAISIALIISTLVIAAQVRHVRDFDPGYQRQGLLVVKNARGARVDAVEQALKREIGRIGGVASVARSNIVPAQDGEANLPVQVPGRSGTTGIGDISVDENFFRTLGIRTIAGRTFSDRYPMDDSTFDSDDSTPVPDGQTVTERGFNAVISEDAISLLGYRDARDAIGRQLGVRVDGGMTWSRATIIGVVGRVQYRSARDEVKPAMYVMRRNAHNALIVRYEADRPGDVRDRVRMVWQRLLPEVPFEAEFAEESLARLHQADDERGIVFGAFSILAILIACLGLFGLAAFAAERRTREIGIRKVFGARARDIVNLLVWQFTKPVVIANLIAWPAAWWMMRDWLNGFSTRIDLGPGPFLLAAAIALAIAVGTVAGHAFKVARLSPIHALRYE